MLTLLVIDRDDGFLPKGWVSAVLPDHTTPSDYESSGRLWRAVAVPDDPVFKKICQDVPGANLIRALVYNQGRITEVESAVDLIASRLSNNLSALKPVPGPEHLDRSQSTVWDYGPGRTYSTPQAAFDALVSQEGSNPFTETHYVRGWSGTYGQGASGYVLALVTVSPTRRYPMVIDAASGETVIFDDEGGDICLVGDGVDHVRVDDLKLKRGAFGIAPANPLVGGTVTRDWQIQRCECDGSAGGMFLGISVINSDQLRILDCHLHEISLQAIGGYTGYADAYKTLVEVSGCLINITTSGIWNNAEVTWVLINNTTKSQSYGVKHEGTKPLVLAGLINNVFTGISVGYNAIHSTDLDPQYLRLLHSDGNCFHPGSSGHVANLNGTTLDLDGWREYYGQDQNSVEADPLLDNDLVPGYGSPCLGGGVCWDISGKSGGKRAASMDIGFEQVTEACVPGIAVRREPEIVRRK
jgi:hypothetical protein